MANVLNAVLIAVFCIVINQVAHAEALECYQCISTEDERCGDPWDWKNLFNPPDTKECAGKCMKLVGGVGDDKVVTRSCNPACFEAGVKIGSLNTGTSCCESSKCNSSGMVKVNTLAVVLMVVMAVWKIL